MGYVGLCKHMVGLRCKAIRFRLIRYYASKIIRLNGYRLMTGLQAYVSLRAVN